MEDQNNMTQPQTQYVVVKKKSKAKWIILAIVAVIIVAIIGLSGGGDDTASEKSIRDIKPGSSVTYDGINIVYKACDTDFKNYSEYATVKDGYKVIQAVFDFENNSESDTVLENFECYADGVKCDEFYSVDDYSSPTLETVSAGKKFVDAKVYFEVPADAEVIELEYEYDIWNEYKYTFIVE